MKYQNIKNAVAGIYIPLWIDLNDIISVFIFCFYNIYIPLWIDLNLGVDFSTPNILSFTFHYG